jgi:hypothetical protein
LALEADKKKIADELRSLLGTDIQFERLSLEDLNKLYAILNNVQRLALVGAQVLRNRVVMGVGAGLRGTKLGDLLRDERLFGEGGILGNLAQGDGILGLGLLPILIGSSPPAQRAERQKSGTRSGYRRSRKNAPGAEGEAEEHPDHG